jgi:hypothetical protein
MGCWAGVKHYVYLNCCTLPGILVLLYVGFSYAVCVFALTSLIELAAMKHVKQIKARYGLRACMYS